MVGMCITDCSWAHGCPCNWLCAYILSFHEKFNGHGSAKGRDGGGTVGPFNRKVTIQRSIGCRTKEGEDLFCLERGIREDCLEEGAFAN